MQNQLEEFAEAAKGIACLTMKNYGGAMANLASFAYAGGPKLGAAVTLGLGLAQWAAKNNCEYDPDKQGGGTDPYAPTGCKKATDFCLKLKIGGIDNQGNPFEAVYARDVREFQSLEPTVEYNEILKKDLYGLKATYEEKDEGWVSQNWGNWEERRWIEVESSAGCQCLEQFPNVPNPPPTYTHTTAEGCTLNVNFKSLVQGNDGTVGGLWQIEPAAETRANGGGVISGCNFAPTMYYDGGGSDEPPRVYPIPSPEPPGDDWWKDLLKTALATAAGNLLAQGIKELLAPQIAPASFNFIAPCNKKPDGTPEEVIYEWDEQDYQSRVLSQQAVIMEILQQHLNWKTPICFGNEGKGDYRTISFISVESSPYGDGRLRKRFRYRSQSGIGLDGVVDHWKDFAFDAGDVCVQHRGSALGSPQVWAASADEGKRVILHAAGEAGIDPNQVGEWSIGGSDNPRYGVFGRMIVNSKGGYYWISSRLGENGRPLVATT